MTPPEIITGDCRETMATLPKGHFHCCVTSPPYFGLRDYGGDEREIGREATPDEFVAAMRAVFGGKGNDVGVWRVLRSDGVLWLNLGDSYASKPAGSNGYRDGRENREARMSAGVPLGLKPKDLIGIPWRVALALQADGWYLRDAIVWHKPAPMPGSQRNRCTSAYEFVFQLTKSPRYFFDLEAIKEPSATGSWDAMPPVGGVKAPGRNGNATYSGKTPPSAGMRTPRNVWTIAHEGFKEAHFATFPSEIPTRCIKASTSEKGCCSECGAPMARVVERDRVPTRPGTGSKVARVSDDDGSPYEGHAGMVVGNRDPQRHQTQTRTAGWERTCTCGVFGMVPCRVLDPFNGAGTTGLAAARLGREYLGLELNPEYAGMAERRIAKAMHPSTYVNTEAAEPSPLFAGGQS